MDPYDDGYNTAHGGGGIDANPYEEGTEAWMAWNEGFDAGVEDATANHADDPT